MIVELTWNQGKKTMNLPTMESSFYQSLSSELSQLPIPNRATVSCPLGNAVYDIIKKAGACFIREDSNSISFAAPATDYPVVYLTCVNPTWNNYKFYRLEQKGDQVIATYGRIGTEKGEMFGERTHTYPKHMFWIKYREKLAKGYVDQTKVYLQSQPPVDAIAPASTSAKTVDASETVANALYALLRSYAKKHVETVCMSSTVTQGMVDASRGFLTTIYERKDVQSFNDTLLQLLAVSPRRVRKVAELLAEKPEDFARIIIREEDLLAAMEVLVSKPKTAANGSKEGFLNVEVYIATEKQRQQVLDHLSPQLHPKVKQVYRVIPQEQQKRFNIYLKKYGIKRVMQLWHGSRNENWLSIIQNGLKLRPDAIITGKMFGDGIYFAPSSMKSWGYTSFRGTYWAKGTQNQAFMALYATAYGNPKDVYASQRFTQDTLDGKNCVHAHAGTALRNDEIIYYSEDAMVLNYLVEFAE